MCGAETGSTGLSFLAVAGAVVAVAVGLVVVAAVVVVAVAVKVVMAKVVMAKVVMAKVVMAKAVTAKVVAVKVVMAQTNGIKSCVFPNYQLAQVSSHISHMSNSLFAFSIGLALFET